MKPFGPLPEGVGCAKACSAEPTVSRQLELRGERASEGLSNYEHYPKADS